MESAHRLVAKISRELPGILRQLESSDPVLRTAAIMRLRDFAAMTEPWRQRCVSPMNPLTFVGMSLKRDD